jgi:hypothetical protein
MEPERSLQCSQEPAIIIIIIIIIVVVVVVIIKDYKIRVFFF